MFDFLKFIQQIESIWILNSTKLNKNIFKNKQKAIKACIDIDWHKQKSTIMVSKKAPTDQISEKCRKSSHKIPKI